VAKNIAHLRHNLSMAKVLFYLGSCKISATPLLQKHGEGLVTIGIVLPSNGLLMILRRLPDMI
jgi:hypothetical protein